VRRHDVNCREYKDRHSRVQRLRPSAWSRGAAYGHAGACYRLAQGSRGPRAVAIQHPALGDAQARKLLEAPPADTVKGARDRAILATLLYHGIRRQELCGLRVRDIQSRQGVMHFRVKGKRGKIRFVPVHTMAERLIEEYLALAGHGGDAAGPVFRPVTNNPL
jgi:integrase